MNIGQVVVITTNDKKYPAIVESVGGANQDVLGVVYWPDTEPTTHGVDFKPGTGNGTWQHVHT